jgi:hypothetical protein
MRKFDYKDISIGDIENNAHLTFICDGDKKEVLVEREEELDLEQYGFRKGFDWETRFDLKTYDGDYLVSTVDLGLNHSFTEIPLYYETMIFKVENNKINYSDLYCERYTTEEEAREGHEKAIEYVKNELEKEKE